MESFGFCSRFIYAAKQLARMPNKNKIIAFLNLRSLLWITIKKQYPQTSQVIKFINVKFRNGIPSRSQKCNENKRRTMKIVF